MTRNKEIDPGGLDEYSVVFTNRSVNHMSAQFCLAMRDISAGLKTTYGGDAVALVPGGGTFGMESVARLFAGGEHCLVLQNGWFSYRWRQILETGKIAAKLAVCLATTVNHGDNQTYRPAAIQDIVDKIKKDRPAVVFAPHVETSSGVLLPADYIAALTEVVHAHGGIFVLDCIASGAQWVDMEALGVDVLITAPQKGWSSTPCAAAVVLSRHALSIAENRESSSYSCDLKKWLSIMRTYEEGGHAYHTTMPTDALIQFRNAIMETRSIGLTHLADAQKNLGTQVRGLLESAGYPSVAADGFKSNSVVVSYTDKPEIKNGSLFAKAGMQIAAGVPLMCGEPTDFSTFRIGLFGLDKLNNVEKTVQRLEKAIMAIDAMK
ncbi:MAG: aminotransferase class V-fold PLP-dependent enzyme [Planctomycetota bacterium]|nr:aminotransferase class V-fold PLP-dependent enzyme [Planctomycetota bacterium]